MKRTIKSAQAAFLEMAPALNPEAYRLVKSELDAALAKANVIARDYVARTASDHLALRDELLVEACDLRDEYAALIAAGELGTLTAAEFESQFMTLEGAKRLIARRATDLDHSVEVVARIEDNAEEWVDSTFYARYPELTPEFSF